MDAMNSLGTFQILAALIKGILTSASMKKFKTLKMRPLMSISLKVETTLWSHQFCLCMLLTEPVLLLYKLGFWDLY